MSVVQVTPAGHIRLWPIPLGMVLNGYKLQDWVVRTHADLDEAPAFATERKVQAADQPQPLEHSNNIFSRLKKGVVTKRIRREPHTRIISNCDLGHSQSPDRCSTKRSTYRASFHLGL